MPRCWRFSGGVFVAKAFLVLPSATADEHSANPLVLELSLNREVEPVLAAYIDEGLADAASRHAALVLITMDTPGGLGESMKDMIQHILASPVPVAVYVSPTGARGASAGFFILLSADIAAMAPATHTGAASPVVAIGGFQLQIDETMRRKMFNDTTAFLRSYTEKRGRNPTLAETAVTDAKAFTEKEALDGKLIDLIASSPEDLLRQLDGRTITRFDGTKMVLSLKNPVTAPFELSARQSFLARIVEPDVFFVLLMVGVLGLYTEFTHPGMIAPGVIGGICAVLALYAMHILPVNFAGVLLILLALALFILEAKFTSHGVLAIGGIVSMVLGAMFLIRSPLTSGGVSLGCRTGCDTPVRAHHYISDAACTALAFMEIDDGKGRADWRRGNCHLRAGRWRGRNDSRSWRALAGRFPASGAGREAGASSQRRGSEAVRRAGGSGSHGKQVECVYVREGRHGDKSSWGSVIYRNYSDLDLEFALHHQGMGTRCSSAVGTIIARS